jgi:hypothetical protein
MKLGEITTSSNIHNTYSKQKELYDNLAKRNKFVFINCCKLINKNRTLVQKIENKNIKVLYPENYKDLKKILAKDRFYLINNLSIKFEHLRIHLNLNKKNLYQISFDTLSGLSSSYNENWKTVNIYKKLTFLFNKKLVLYFYKLLNILGLIKQIDNFYLSRRDIYYNHINIKKNFFLKRFKKFTPTLSKSMESEKIYKEKFIIYIDPNFKHQDFAIRGAEINEKDINDFTIKLSKYLKKLSKIFKLKVIICLHPSSSKKYYLKLFKDFKLTQYETERYLNDSFIVLFHESSLAIRGFYFKKYMVNIKHLKFGSYFEERRKLFERYFDVYTHDFNKKIKNEKFYKKKFLKNLDKRRKKNYKLLNKIFFNKNETSKLSDLIIKEKKMIELVFDK